MLTDSLDLAKTLIGLGAHSEANAAGNRSLKAAGERLHYEPAF